MKNINIVMLAVLSLAVFAPIQAQAVDTVSPAVSPKFRQELKDQRQGTRNEIKNLKDGLKTTVKNEKSELKGTISVTREEFRKKRMTVNQMGMYNSFLVREKALKSYQARIQQRLDEKLVKLPANQNLADAKTKLGTLAGLFATLDANTASYKATVDSIATSSDPTTLLATLKTQAKAVNNDLKIVRQTLVDSLRLIVKAK